MSAGISSVNGLNGDINGEIPNSVKADIDALIELLLERTCDQSPFHQKLKELLIRIILGLVTDSKTPNDFETDAIFGMIFGPNGPKGPVAPERPEDRDLVKLLFGKRPKSNHALQYETAAIWPETWEEDEHAPGTSKSYKIVLRTRQLGIEFVIWEIVDQNKVSTNSHGSKSPKDVLNNCTAILRKKCHSFSQKLSP